jgi:hypothetical protein
MEKTMSDVKRIDISYNSGETTTINFSIKMTEQAAISLIHSCFGDSAISGKFTYQDGTFRTYDIKLRKFVK